MPVEGARRAAACRRGEGDGLRLPVTDPADERAGVRQPADPVRDAGGAGGRA